MKALVTFTNRTITTLWSRGIALASSMSPALVVTVLCFFLYLYKPLIQSSRDNMPLRWGATLLATRGTLNFAELPIDPNRFYSLRVLEDGSVRSHTPLGTALLAAPVFLSARVLGMEFTDENVVFLDSLAATILTALAAGMAAHLARSAGRKSALFVGLAVGLATASWSTASRCLWQHTGAQFTMLAALCVLESDSRRLLRLGLGAALLAFCFWCRPALLPVIVVIAGNILLRNKRDFLIGVVAGVCVLLGWLTFNYLTYGSPLGTYVSLRALGPDTFTAYPRRLWGHLFSPNRGMYVFSPLLLLASIPMVTNAVKWRNNKWLAMLAWGALVGLLARGFFYGWFGGHCYGSRYSLDSSALMLIGAAPYFSRLLSTLRKAIFPVGLFFLSCAIQFLGVARDYESWNVLMGMSREENAWNWRTPQILHCLTCGEWTRGPLLSPSTVNLPADGVLNLRNDPDSPYIRYGFTYLEPWGTCAMPPRAGIVFHLAEAQPLRVRCEVTSQVFPYQPTTVGLAMNGKKFGEIVLLKVDPKYEDLPWFVVPKELVKPGLNTLELRVNRVCYPYASSSPMGAAVNRIIIVP